MQQQHTQDFETPLFPMDKKRPALQNRGEPAGVPVPELVSALILRRRGTKWGLHCLRLVSLGLGLGNTSRLVRSLPPQPA